MDPFEVVHNVEKDTIPHEGSVIDHSIAKLGTPVTPPLEDVYVLGAIFDGARKATAKACAKQPSTINITDKAPNTTKNDLRSELHVDVTNGCY